MEYLQGKRIYEIDVEIPLSMMMLRPGVLFRLAGEEKVG